MIHDSTGDRPGAPEIVDRDVFQAELEALRIREKAHTREGDAIAAARRRLPMVKMDGATPLIGDQGTVTLLDAFEGRSMLIAYYFMWHAGHPAPEQCEGCTWVTSQVRELSYVHSRDVTYATFCQGPYAESARYRDFMGWQMPWYSAPRTSLDTLLVGRRVGLMYIGCYLRQGSDVFETYWTTWRGVEAMDNNYRLLDLTVYGRQEAWEDSPAGCPPKARRGWKDACRRASHRAVASHQGRPLRRSGIFRALIAVRSASCSASSSEKLEWVTRDRARVARVPYAHRLGLLYCHRTVPSCPVSPPAI